MDAEHIIIIGAGASGLMAARELSKAGKRVAILEARDRIGGRICPLSKEIFGYEAQGGAEFVHGEAPITKALFKEAGITLTHGTEWWSVVDGEPAMARSGLPDNEQLKEKLGELKEDIPLAQFLATYFIGEEHAELRERTLRRVQSYDAADPNRKSSFALRDDLLDEGNEQAHNIKEGYGALLRFLESECKKSGVEILLNCKVAGIDQAENGICIHATDGTTYDAHKVIITVPLPVIHEITFIPALPDKVEAAAQIGFGGVIKVLIRFKTKWWTGARQKNFERLFFMFSDEVIPTWWTQYPEPHLTLTGWLAGPPAQTMADRSDDEIIASALASLSNIFKITIDELRREFVTAHVSNWIKDPLTRGAYSYTTPETVRAKRELTTPVNNKIYFAGEALSERSAASTVEGALASGLETARKILDL